MDFFSTVIHLWGDMSSVFRLDLIFGRTCGFFLHLWEPLSVFSSSLGGLVDFFLNSDLEIFWRRCAATKCSFLQLPTP